MAIKKSRTRTLLIQPMPRKTEGASPINWHLTYPSPSIRAQCNVGWCELFSNASSFSLFCQVIHQILTGHRLFCPRDCPRDIYRIMDGCWSHQPLSRLPIKQIRTMLDACRTRACSHEEPRVERPYDETEERQRTGNEGGGIHCFPSHHRPVLLQLEQQTGPPEYLQVINWRR